MSRVTEKIDLAPVLTPGGQVVEEARTAHRAPQSARRRRRARTGALLVTPALALIVAFVLFPLGFAIYISLTNWPLIGSYHYIGFSNYRELFSDPEFRHAATFTLTYTAIVTLPIFFLGYALAVLLRANRFGSKVFRTLFFLPFVVGLTTESFMFAIELQPGSGWVDWLLSRIGVASSTQAWTVSHGRALLMISVIVVWFASGLTMLILTGGMQGIPRELYEAADVDGASAWQRFVSITLPMLRPAIFVALIFRTITAIQTFDIPYAMTGGGPGDSTETLAMYIQKTTLDFLDFGYGSALAALMFVVSMIATSSYLRYTRRSAGRD